MILQVKELKFSYKRGKEIFSDVNFSINKGEILSILGPNGAGKSTLLKCLANLLKPTSGQIVLDGRLLGSLKPHEIAQKIGYVPQIHTPTYAYTVREFVVMGRAPYLGLFSKPVISDYDLVDEALEMLNISHLADKAYTEISGGERQQATIARVLVQQPEIIMLDEPTAHLDYGNQLRMLKLIWELSNKGYSIIMTTHQPDHVIMLGNYVGILGDDGVMKVGKSEKMIQEKLLTELYSMNIKLVYVDDVNRKICVPSSIF